MGFTYCYPGDWMKQIFDWRKALLFVIVATDLAVVAAPLDPTPLLTTEAELNKILQYQMFGADYLKVGDRFSLTNVKGYFGSNDTVTAGAAATIAPTILVGGDGSGYFGFSNDQAPTPKGILGNILVEGQLNLPNLNYFYKDVAYYNTNRSPGGTPTNIYAGQSNWPSGYQTLVQDLSIPALDWGSCVSGTPSVAKGANFNSSSVIDISTVSSSVVDLCLGNISMGNDQTLLIKSTPTQLVRVYVNGNFTVADRFTIALSTDGSTPLATSSYQGTLLVYINGMWTMGNDGKFMGSYIQNGYVSMPDRINITGQLAAKGISIHNDFSASMFKYVPFNPPTLEPTVDFDGGVQLTEANTAIRTLIVSLDKPAIIDVSLDWEFQWISGTSPLASAADIVNTLPVSGTLSIPIGESQATISVRVVDDADLEGTENFQLVLSNINGAVFPLGATSYTIPLSIQDNDDNNFPTTQDGSVNAVEDVVFSFASSDFVFNDVAPGPATLQSISIRSVPAAGTLFYDADNNGAFTAGEAVGVNQVIQVSNISRLKFVGAANANGSPYATFRFTVSDGLLSSAQATMTIHVAAVNDVPTLSAIADITNMLEDQSRTVTLTVGDVDGIPVAQPSAVSSNLALFPSLAVTGSGATRTLTLNPAADQSGTATITVTFSDGTVMVTRTFLVTVLPVNDAPSFTKGGNQTVNEDAGAQSVGGWASAISPGPSNEGSQTVSIIVSGNSNTALFSAQPAISPTGVLSYTPAANAYGVATITLYIQDNGGTANGGVNQSATTQFTITVNSVNDIPVANTDTTSTHQDQAVVIPIATLLANDTDADGDALTVTSVQGATHGSISWVGSNITFTPDALYSGPAGFTYTVSDGHGGTATGTVNIAIDYVNTPPTLGAIGDEIINEDALLTIAGTGADVDVGDILTYSLVTAPAGMTIHATTGVISWTPTNAQVRALPYAVTVHVQDGFNTSPADRSFAVTVLNVNDAPVLAAIPNQTTDEDVAYSYQVVASDIDQDVDAAETLDFFLDAAPAGMQISATGQITWVPSSADVGVHTVRVVVADRAGLSDTATYQLTVLNVNDAPIFGVVSDTTTLEDVKFTRTIQATDADAGDVLTYSFVAKPVGMVINSSTGVMSWTPDNSKVGSHVITVRATDGSGAFVDKIFTLTVVNVNDAPVIASPSFTIAEDAAKGTFVGKITATDEDPGSVLSYLLVKNDKFTVGVDGSIKVSKTLDFESAPVETLWVAVTDGFASDTARVIIKISNVEERSVVEIIKVADADSSWVRPDTVWTKDSLVDVTWSHDGVSQVDRVEVHEGVNIIIKQYKGTGKDTYGRDTVVILVNRQPPEIHVVLPPDRPEPKPNTVMEDPLNPADTTAAGDTVFYINNDEKSIFAQVIVVGKDLQLDTIIVRIQPDLVEGLNTVEYSYTDAFGNEATGNVTVFLDITPPKVVIVRPLDSTKTNQFVVPVSWTVDGRSMDTLNQQSLVVGWNMVERTYRDRAGNEGSDTIWVFLRARDKDVSISLEEPLVMLDHKKIEKFYEINPPEDDEYYALSFVNTETGREEEKQYGMGASTKKGDDAEPYPGLMGKHLGPTLRLEIKLPHMGGVDAAGKLRGGDIRSILEPDGRVAITEGAGEDRVLIPLSEYAEKYCIEDAFAGLSPGELLDAPIFRSKIYIEVMVYDAIGQFVDNMKLVQEVGNHKYISDGGMLTGYMEIKPRKDEGLKNQRGRSYGTGAFVIRGRVEAVSTQLCDTPTGLRGDKTKNSSETLKNFGFRREGR